MYCLILGSWGINFAQSYNYSFLKNWSKFRDKLTDYCIKIAYPVSKRVVGLSRAYFIYWQTGCIYETWFEGENDKPWEQY